MSRKRLTDTSLQIIKMLPAFDANLDNLIIDFTDKVKPRPENEWTPPIYSGMFMSFISGMINVMDPSSKFNSEFNHEATSASDKQNG